MEQDSLQKRIRVLSSVIFVAGLVFALPTMIVVCFGLIPTLAAYAVDPYKRSHYLSICVFSTNFAAITPFVFQLWDSGHTFIQAVDIIADPVLWLTILCGAAVGWIFYGIFPRLISAYVVNMWKYKISALEKHQKKLIETWGEDLRPQTTDSSEGDEDAGSKRKQGSADEAAS